MKQEWNPGTCNNMDGLQEHNAKWNKPDAKDTCCIIPGTQKAPIRQIPRDRKQIGGCQGLGKGGIESYCLMAWDFFLG